MPDMIVKLYGLPGLDARAEGMKWTKKPPSYS
jgi:hypothetical protein